MRRRAVARLIDQAANAAGDRAVDAAERDNYTQANAWRDLAIDLRALVRRAVELLARG